MNEIRSSEWQTDAPLVIAHRGACRRAPENTLAAFRLAAELGADAIELDTKLTKDGAVVVMHDQTVDRTTSGRGAVRALSLREIRSLDAGGHFGAGFVGEQVPTLAEVFEQEGRRLLINVEMGNYARPWNRLPEAVIGIVREHALEARVLLSSFNPIALIKARRLAPEIPVALLLVSYEPRLIRDAFAGWVCADMLHPDVGMTSSVDIEALHSEGRRVNVWTVNEEELMRSLVEAGVDGLITDVPEMARRVIDGARERG